MRRPAGLARRRLVGLENESLNESTLGRFSFCPLRIPASYPRGGLALALQALTGGGALRARRLRGAARTRQCESAWRGYGWRPRSLPVRAV